MTPTVLVALLAAVLLSVALLTLRAWRSSQHNRTRDLGVVSTQWISELRRDEPWTSS